MPEPKILLLDIEATGLKADFGVVLCVGYKWLDNPEVFCPAIFDYEEFKHDPTAEQPLLRDILPIIEEADMLITYFGTGYDKKFLTAKFMEYGIGIWPNVPHVDLYYAVKGNFAISRKSLQNVGYYLGLSNEKTPVEGKIWRRAQAGHRDSITYIVEHCKADVLILEEAYLKMRPLIRTHPRVRGLAGCRVCGSESLQRRGTLMTKTSGRQVRLSCTACGSWESRPEATVLSLSRPSEDSWGTGT